MEQVSLRYFFQKGQTLLVTIFILGTVSLAVTASLATQSVTRVTNISGEISGQEAAYAAYAGIEEVIYRLANDSNFGNGTWQTIEDTSLGEASFIATISGDNQVRIATATGTLGSYIRKSEIKLSASASAGSISLAYAAQIGEGGINMHANSRITAAGGADGNVYSNGIIQGYSNARIVGNAWAVNGINPSSGRITITKDAYASFIQYCTVSGNSYSPTPPSNCTVSGSQNIAPAPTPLPLPSVDLDYWRNAAQTGGIIQGDYVQNSGTSSLGPKVITGNLTLNSNSKMIVTGALWVYGTFTMNSNTQLILDEAFGQNGTVILLDHPTDKANQGRLVLNSNAAVKKTSQGGYILFVSTNEQDNCNTKAAEFNSNAEAPAIIANSGCIQMNSNADLVALSAKRLVLNSNAAITYETAISSALYLPGPGVGGSEGFGWQVDSWKEIP